MKRQFKKAYFKTLRLLFYSSDSSHKLAMGGAQGIFWGLTPTVGLQITVLTFLYSLSFVLLRVSKKFKVIEFNLPIAIALTWISNPFNAPILYFLFYITGAFVMPGHDPYSLKEFLHMLKPLLNVESVFSLQALKDYIRVASDVFRQFGTEIIMPMCVGSLIIAIPTSILSYIFIRWLLRKYTSKKSESLLVESAG